MLAKARTKEAPMAAIDPRRDSTRNWSNRHLGLVIAGLVGVMLLLTIGFFLGAGTPGSQAPPVARVLSSDRPVPQETPLTDSAEDAPAQ
jgi:hypothetical protein